MRDLSNVSALFSNLNSKNSGFNLMDYAQIKNGSYGKLMKAYYSEQSSTDKKSSKVESNKKPNQATDIDTTGLNKVQTEASSLKDAAKALQDKELWKGNDTEKITKTVKNFVSEYNDVITQSAKVSSKDVANETASMKSMTNTMSKALSSIGITVGSDNKLSVDEDKLKNADIKTVKAMFDGAYTYGGQIADDASQIASAASRNSSLYTSNATLQNSLGSIFSNGI